MGRFCWLRVTSIAAVTWYTRCVRFEEKDSPPSEGEFENLTVMPYLGEFGKDTCPGSGKPATDVDSCKLSAQYYCNNPGVGVGCDVNTFEEKDDGTMPPGCSLKATDENPKNWVIFFNKNTQGALDQKHKRVCYLYGLPTSDVIRWRVNKQRKTQNRSKLSQDGQATLFAFTIAMSIYKGDIISMGWASSTWLPKFTVDGWETAETNQYAVIKFQTLKKRCVRGKEADKKSVIRLAQAYTSKGVNMPFFKHFDEKAVRPGFDIPGLEAAGFARICLGRGKRKNKGCIEVGVFKTDL